MKKLLIPLTLIVIASYMFSDDNIVIPKNNITKLLPHKVQRAFFKNHVSQQNTVTNPIHQTAILEIRKTTSQQLINCLNSSDCNLNKAPSNKRGYSNKELGPIHLELEKRISLNGDQLSDEQLFALLNVSNTNVFLLSLEQLLARDIDTEAKSELKEELTQQSSEVFAQGLLMASKFKLFKREEAFALLNSKAKSNFSTAFSLTKKLYNFKPSRIEFTEVANNLCGQYGKMQDKELFNTLRGNLKKQANYMNLEGIYFCNQFL